jgi:hypothetical protein
VHNTRATAKMTMPTDSAKKAIDRPSGDQNGYCALSVAASIRAEPALNDRIQSRSLPLESGEDDRASIG